MFYTFSAAKIAVSSKSCIEFVLGILLEHILRSCDLDLFFTLQWYKMSLYTLYSKTCVKWLLSNRPEIGFQDQFSLNAGHKYCRMLQAEHSAILLTYIRLTFVIEIFVLSIFEWPFYTGFTLCTFVFQEIKAWYFI